MVKKIKIDNETNELNYLFGGYFSGCGKIYLFKTRQPRLLNSPQRFRWELRVMVYFEDLKDAELFKKNWGGGVVKEIKNPPHWGGKLRRRYTIQVKWSDAGFFIKAIQPYLMGSLIKKRAKLGLKFHNYQQKHWHQSSDAVREQKHKYYLQMKRLK